ncbi:hypothetical protein EVAR_68205_1 [Eumeta japonica]|uniref:Uncharacterized protein n=1 Tax=Eumeta variegata TaxID=151549 RepID=A0A4C2A2I7_EUMVA|nr:hypothetical protein EVAR_68205_1 [Eumeta japonica]
MSDNRSGASVCFFRTADVPRAPPAARAMKANNRNITLINYDYLLINPRRRRVLLLVLPVDGKYSDDQSFSEAKSFIRDLGQRFRDKVSNPCSGYYLFKTLYFCGNERGNAATIMGTFGLGQAGGVKQTETDYSEYKEVVNKYGQVVYMKENLIKKLEEEANTWHWTPWVATRTKMYDNYVVEVECTSDSVENFPDGWLTGASAGYNDSSHVCNASLGIENCYAHKRCHSCGLNETFVCLKNS